MIYAKEIIGLPIFSLTDNKIIGIVENLILDTRSRELFALIISGNKITKDKNLLSIFDFTISNKEIVIIENIDVISDKETLPKGMLQVDNGGLILGSKLFNGKNYLGKVYNFTIDDNNKLNRIYTRKMFGIMNILEDQVFSERNIKKFEKNKIILAL